MILKSESKYHQNDPVYALTLLDSYLQTQIKDIEGLILCNKKAWNNQVCMQDHIMPFLIQHTRRLYSGQDKNIIFVFDNFPGHINDELLEYIQDEGILLSKF